MEGEEGGIFAAVGNNAIMSPTSHLYFDYYQAKNGEPLAIGGLIPLDKVYSYEPVPQELDLNQATKILELREMYGLNTLKLQKW